MKQTARKTNGTKAAVNVLACPHAEVCNAPSMQEELMASLDELSRSVMMLIQRVEQVHDESLQRARVYIESNDQILKALRRVEEKVEGADA